MREAAFEPPLSIPALLYAANSSLDFDQRLELPPEPRRQHLQRLERPHRSSLGPREQREHQVLDAEVAVSAFDRLAEGLLEAGPGERGDAGAPRRPCGVARLGGDLAVLAGGRGLQRGASRREGDARGSRLSGDHGAGPPTPPAPPPRRHPRASDSCLYPLRPTTHDPAGPWMRPCPVSNRV